jgi:hypothetical protein
MTLTQRYCKSHLFKPKNQFFFNKSFTFKISHLLLLKFIMSKSFKINYLITYRFLD